MTAHSRHERTTVAIRAAVLSGLPSTLIALARGGDPLEATRAAGALLLPGETGTLPLVASAAVSHGVLSLGWTGAIASTMPRNAGRTRTVLHGLLVGAAIAALDLGSARVVRGPRFGPIAELDVLPQVADHLAFGAVVGLMIQPRRARA